MNTLDPKFLLEKLDTVFQSLKYAAQLNVAFGFVIKKQKMGVVRIIIHTKRKQFWNYLNLLLPEKIWQKSRIY